MMGKIIAIDFGLKRTGLAISDESQIFAFGLKTVESKLLMQELKTLVSTEKIETIVVGQPKRLNTEDTHISENVRLFKKALEQTFPFILCVSIDERFTSKMASQAIAQSGLKKSARESKALIDEVSATIILQDYLHTLGK